MRAVEKEKDTGSAKDETNSKGDISNRVTH